MTKYLKIVLKVIDTRQSKHCNRRYRKSFMATASVKIEKPYTIVLDYPGFSAEISRTTEGDYLGRHVATRQDTPD